MFDIFHFYPAASIIFALLGFIISITLDRRRKRPSTLQQHLGRALAASGVPAGFILVCGAFRPAILLMVPGLEVSLAFGGMALIYVSYVAAFKSGSR
jgi:hypothetical protein